MAIVGNYRPDPKGHLQRWVCHKHYYYYLTTHHCKHCCDITKATAPLCSSGQPVQMASVPMCSQVPCRQLSSARWQWGSLRAGRGGLEREARQAGGMLRVGEGGYLWHPSTSWILSPFPPLPLLGHMQAGVSPGIPYLGYPDGLLGLPGSSTIGSSMSSSCTAASPSTGRRLGLSINILIP